MTPTSEPATSTLFVPQTLDAFCERKFPEKTPLIEGVLYRRDQISLTGRRRNGKTTLLSNIAIAGACGEREYLGFTIPRPFTTVAFYLEDDGGELQAKLVKMKNGRAAHNCQLYIREDFQNWKIPIAVKEPTFRERVFAACEAARPDLITFDNLSMLISANYNDSIEIHALMEFTFCLTQQFNAAVLIAAHPRKGGAMDRNDSAPKDMDLETNPEKFFEATMGSSNFINQTGSLWGIQRREEQTAILLGSQRVTGQQAITRVEKSDSDWFELSADQAPAAYQNIVLATPKREGAWQQLKSLPDGFSWEQAREATKLRLSSQSSFSGWFNELRRNRLVVETTEKRYRLNYMGPNSSEERLGK